MGMKFSKLTRPGMRHLKPGKKITEQCITFQRLPNGDGRFSVNVMVDAHRIHRIIGKESEGVTRTQAENFIEQKKTEARESRLNLPNGRKLLLNFQVAAKQYIEKLKEEGGKDINAKERRLNQHLIPFLKNKPLAKIRTFDIERFKKVRLEDEAKHGTINRELAVISHVFRKAVEWRWIDYKPAIINRLKEDSGRIVYLTTEQIEKLRESAMKDQNSDIYKFITIGLETAMRKMEILSIRLKHIDICKRIIYIPNSKTGAREQPITNRLAEFLGECVDKAGPRQEWLFPSSKSRTGHVVNIEKPFRRAVKAAGLNPEDVVRHTLRHTAITHLVQAGVDLPTVKRISGHKTLGAQGRNRTTDTRIFSPLLYRLSYLTEEYIRVPS